VGIYDPNRDPVEIRFDMERVKHWLSVGAQPSDTVSELLQVVEKAQATAAKA
jgi:small subunit ribosomal protein S16